MDSQSSFARRRASVLFVAASLGWLADSLLVIALGPILATTAWLLTRRQAANTAKKRPLARAGKGRPWR